MKEPTEEDYFENAVSDDALETPSDLPQPEADEPVAVEQARDERGRFSAQEQADEPEPPKEPESERESVGVKQLREALERSERRNEELQRHMMSRQQPQPAAPQKVEAKPDPLLDPDGYEKYLENRFEERMLNERRENSLQMAARSYGQEFADAYAAAQQRVNPQLKAMMQESRDPGETLIQWFRSERMQREIGGDLNAYKARLREEALKDPEFRKQAMEAWRTDAGQQRSNGRPAIELAPSLNGASRASSLPKGSSGEESDYELFGQITGR